MRVLRQYLGLAIMLAVTALGGRRAQAHKRHRVALHAPAGVSGARRCRFRAHVVQRTRTLKLTHYPQPRQVVRAPDRALRSRPSMTATLQREHWNNQPTYLGDLFRVSKTRGDKTLSALT